MNTALRTRLAPFHSPFQHELLPLVEADSGETLSVPMQRLPRIGALIQIERFVPSSLGRVGRPARERMALTRAFAAKAVLGLARTVDLIERLHAEVRLLA